MPRKFFRSIVVTLGVLLGAHANAQPYPSKPIRIFVTIGPGAAADVLTRVVGEELAKRLGQPIIVEFVSFLRPELKFPDVDELVAQMAADCTEAKRILARTPDIAPPL